MNTKGILFDPHFLRYNPFLAFLGTLQKWLRMIYIYLLCWIRYSWSSILGGARAHNTYNFKTENSKKCVKSHLDFQNRKICNSKKIPRRLLAEYEEEQARLERLSEKVDKLPEIQFWGCFFACLHKNILQCMVCGCGNLATLTLALVRFFCSHLLLEACQIWEPEFPSHYQKIVKLWQPWDFENNHNRCSTTITRVQHTTRSRWRNIDMTFKRIG